ncbi:protein of unknown function [Clostridium sp. USBA 49]|uniref:DUF3298 and DUF4163 domain-containing protein n=1 Tax=Clostridium sp. USBA 49 TaxID=1881060 RepID=UPI000999DB2B|nr:DUF3298 and DUF4163 domain-containing protein [Clostridium sp. USBA 49]SKA80768.1 protein of unknown function [Clostridium sp. USBA 49]
MGHKRKPALITDVKLENPSLNLTYPKVSGLKHKSAQSSINRYIKKEVYSLLNKEGYGVDEGKKFTAGYTVKLNKRGTLSILLEVFSFVKGEEKRNTVRKTINVSLKDARIYYLDDLFSRKIKKSKWISILNDIIRNQISFKGINLSKEFKGIWLKQDYYLTEDALVIYFQMNEYTEPEYGFPEFTIFFNDIIEIINNKGPIGRLLRDKKDEEKTADQ